MSIALTDLAGHWYIVQSNFPMWLKGDKTNPTFRYTVATQKGEQGLEDLVEYQQAGKSKRIRGFDRVLNAEQTQFLWRGKGLLGLLTSVWSIVHLAPDHTWAIIAFEKTWFTPKGYDVIARQPALTLQQAQAVKTQLQQLSISEKLSPIQQPT